MKFSTKYTAGLLLCIALLSVMMLTGCAHTHSFGDWEETKAPTCQEKGQEMRACDCGETEIQEIEIDPEAHSWNEENMCEHCAQYKDTGVEFTFDGESSTYSVSGYTGTAASVIIPSTYKGYPVTSIGLRAFASCDNLKSVTIPDSITYIDDMAFAYCDGLRSVEIPGNVMRIGEFAFLDCDLLGSVIISDSVTDIGENAFTRCYNLKDIKVDENNMHFMSVDGNLYSKDGTVLIQYAIGKTNTSFVIPESVTSIGDYALEYGTRLESVTIGNNVTSIGNSAFAHCNLTYIDLHEGVTSIGKLAFYSCPNLKNINIAENNPSYMSVDGNLCSKDGTVLIQYAIGKTNTNFVIPDSVTVIGDNAFSLCKNLESITIGNGVISIEQSAFYSCSGLTSIEIPDSVTSISDSAFYLCRNLKSVTIGIGVTSIGSGAFSECVRLEGVTIENTNGWRCVASWDATSETDISSDDLSDRSMAAKLFTSTYKSYDWNRS